MGYQEIKTYKYPKEIRQVLAQVQRDYRAKKKQNAPQKPTCYSDKALKIVKILQFLSKEKIGAVEICQRLNISQAYASQLIIGLEKTGLISIEYKRGIKGIKKVCYATTKGSTINIENIETLIQDGFFPLY